MYACLRVRQIYVGGDDSGRMVMQDSFQLPSNDNDNWLMYPGAKIESTCRLADSALHFNGTLNVSTLTTGPRSHKGPPDLQNIIRLS